MRYNEAKKLHNEDEVIDKVTGESLFVVEVKHDAAHRDVYILCDNCEWYHHRRLR